MFGPGAVDDAAGGLIEQRSGWCFEFPSMGSAAAQSPRNVVHRDTGRGAHFAINRDNAIIAHPTGPIKNSAGSVAGAGHGRDRREAAPKRCPAV